MLKAALRVWCASLVLAAASAANASSSGHKPDFRNARWYDSLQEVKSAETAKLIEHRTQEVNVAVDPPKPWPVEHLYFKGSVLGKEVRILYRFDLDCKQLYEAGYVFDEILNSRELGKLIDAIEDKYNVALDISTPSDSFFASGKLTERTRVQINRDGRLHFHTNETVVYFQSTNFHWMSGWTEGTEPTCAEKTRKAQELKKKL